MDKGADDKKLYVTSISLFSTQQLIDELLNRFDHAVFCGTKVEDRDSKVTIRRWKGHQHTCAGLAQDVGMSALNQLHDIEEDVNLEDT